MLYTVAVVVGLLAGANALTIGTAPVQRVSGVSMKLTRLPGEGDPFVDGVRMPEEGPRPDLAQTWHADSGYIDTDDEPWHSTCKPRTAVMTKGILDGSYTAALPFIAPEEALMDALRAVESEKDVDAAVAAALAAGARPGCPAIDTAEKMLAAAKKDGALKAAAPAKVAAQGKGWDDMGRALGKVHDNSV